jgi:hypothetical protein
MNKSIEFSDDLCKQNVLQEPNNNKNKIREVENITNYTPFRYAFTAFTYSHYMKKERDER